MTELLNLQNYTQRQVVVRILMVVGLGFFYTIFHMANGWLFAFSELSPNVALIYLPAFLRMLNVLVLGKLDGTLSTMLGGLVLLMLDPQKNPLHIDVIHMLCSASGPLLALLVFKHLRGRQVDLLSLADLGLVTLFYCLFNSVLHHFAWALMSPERLGTPLQMLWMMLGDLMGALAGAYVLKWSAKRLGIGQLS